MTEEKKRVFRSIIFPLGFVILLWILKIVEILGSFNFISSGIFPREISGLIGILLAPFIHANFSHLISNTFPLIFLGAGILYFYKDSAFKVIVIIYFLSNLLVWLFARSAYHIGASGLIYGAVSFLFFSGLLRRDTRSIALALIVTFLYGGMIWGILPLENGTSWEAHLFGSFSGILCAFLFRKSDPSKKYDWEDEPDEDRPDKLEVNYKKKKF